MNDGNGLSLELLVGLVLIIALALLALRFALGIMHPEEFIKKKTVEDGTYIPLFEIDPCTFVVEPQFTEEGTHFMATSKEYPGLWEIDDNPVIALNMLWIEIRNHLDSASEGPGKDA